MTEISVLIIDKNPESDSNLSRVLAPEVIFTEQASVRSLRKGILLLSEGDTDFCFISESFDTVELQAFFSDLRALNKPHLAVVQLSSSEVTEETLTPEGFHGVVSIRGTHADKKLIEELHESMKYRAEIIRRVIDVRSAVQFMLKNLDRICNDRKRGIQSPLSNIFPDFILEETSDIDEIMTSYFEALFDLASEADPTIADELEVPQELVERLPFLRESNYFGVSSRVWTRMAKKFGKHRE